jgi:hypothetical protein
MNHLNERWKRWAKEASEKALKILDLEIGDRVWYWNSHQDRGQAWITAHVVSGASKDGYATVNVKLEDAEGLLPDCYEGFVKWGYGWQVEPYSDEKPTPPDKSEVWP